MNDTGDQMNPMTALAETVRNRVTNSVTSPFGHAEYPLANTLDHHGDPGVCGPGSASWPVIGDAAAFVGGIRALLIQAAHPEVVAGVAQHSTYRQDPLGRLSRTSAYVTATTFGAMPEVEAAIAIVRRAHQPVRGTSHRGTAYSAGTPRFAAWVHNALTDSFLAAHQAYGPSAIDQAEADRFVREQAEIGRMLDADPLPDTARELAEWVTNHPAVEPSPGMEETVAFLQDPPLDPAQKAGYRVLYGAAVATIPVRLRETLGVRVPPLATVTGKRMVGFLRWALGSSPSWNVALLRMGAPVPPDLFRQQLPIPHDADSGLSSSP
jgi:uncharacterized protein (DUF2236 family)